MIAAEREALIDQYEDGFRAVSAALAEISEAELEAREAPGEWSPREIVHHLADSEMTSAIRLRLLIAQDAPTLLGYDQEAFVRNLYPERPIKPSLTAFEAARAATTPILRRLSEDQEPVGERLVAVRECSFAHAGNRIVCFIGEEA